LWVFKKNVGFWEDVEAVVDQMPDGSVIKKENKLISISRHEYQKKKMPETSGEICNEGKLPFH